MPSGARAAVGARLRLLAVDGRTCEAVVSAIRVESRFTDRTALYWGDEDDEMGTRREDQTPEQLWDDGQPFLLGSLTPVAGDCSGAIFAQLASSPAPRTYAPVAKPAAAEKRAAIAAFRKLPAWKAEQASFVAEVRELDAAAREWVGLAPGVTPRFDTAYEGSPEVRFYVGRGGERFATVHARGQAGCGDPSGSLGVVFRVEGAGRAARFVPLHAESWSPELEGLVDLDGDGRPEGLRASDDVPAIFELGPENSDIRQQLDLPDHSIYPCPC
ncbi:MAG: hypothetical protein H6745_23130 [Deltaproteobacteria bacterium]|nr:hypothetical protein [Deltaproteobacteria bacterium]